MANRTDPLAQTKHGLNPQNLVEKITRLRVWSSQFWKAKCFALDAERLGLSLYFPSMIFQPFLQYTFVFNFFENFSLNRCYDLNVGS